MCVRRMRPGFVPAPLFHADDALFPALEAVLGAQGSPTAMMREEHKEIHGQGELLRQTLYELNEVEHPKIEAGGARLREMAATGGSAETLRANVEEIARLLDMHFAKEEQILFPMAENILDHEVMDEILRKLETMTL